MKFTCGKGLFDPASSLAEVGATGGPVASACGVHLCLAGNARRAKHRRPRQPLPMKIFHFTEFLICRMCRPSRLILEGRSCGRHVREPGLRWTRQRRARKAGAGRIALRETWASRGRTALPGFVSPASFRLRRQGRENCGEMAGRAYGKTVWSWPSLLRSSSCGCGICVNRRGCW